MTCSRHGIYRACSATHLLLHLLLVAAVSVVATPFPSGFGVQPIDIRVGCTTPMHATSAARAGANWRRNVSFAIDHRGADFLVLRFARRRLPPGARLVVRDHNATDDAAQVQWTGDATTDWHVDHDHIEFTRPFDTQRVVIEYSVPTTITRVAGGCYGFHIDQYRFAARSATRMSTRRHRDNASVRSITTKHEDEDDATESCAGKSDDGTSPAACVRFDTAVVAATRAVARLLVHKASGSVFCTGWLVGCEGHVMTNSHCVTSASDANATAIEFLAYGRTCSEHCDQPLGCAGVVEATSAEIVATSPLHALDFTLLLPRLPRAKRRHLTATYGFLTMRTQPVTRDERIFIPQHPAGFGQRVALKHDASFGRVVSVDDPGCNARNDNLAYQLATKAGSSGAPVVAYADRAVVGLHYCGGCLNSAIPTSQIVDALTREAKLPLCATSERVAP